MNTPSKHALLSASSAYRWLNCPPSARLSESLPDRQTKYTEEGTLAHALGELHLRKRFTTGFGPKKFKTELKKLQENPLYLPEMDRHIETYVDLVNRTANAFRTQPYVAVEQEVDFSAYAPEGFGTCDCLLMGDGQLHIIDLKYGANPNNKTEAENNPQMMLYALGALARYGMLCQVERVAMTICQPRQDYFPAWEISVQELKAWGESIQAVAQVAFDGGGQLQNGDWCRFCKAFAQCPKQQQVHTALEDFGFVEPKLMSNTEVSEVLKRGERLVAWFEAVEKHALQACLDGEEIPGFKVIERAANRKFTDMDAAFAQARASGIEEEMLYERKPITLAQLEKLMGKQPFSDALGTFVFSPPGHPALVPERHQGKPYTQTTVEEDFQEVIHHGKE